MSEASETSQGCGQRCGCTQHANGSWCPERERDGPSACMQSAGGPGQNSQNGKVHKLGEGENTQRVIAGRRKAENAGPATPQTPGLCLDSVLL